MNLSHKGSKLLIDEYPLMVLPSLATRIGLNEAIVVQQVHYWLSIQEQSNSKDHYKGDRWWVWNTYEDWQKQFPWWSIRTIKAVFAKLEEHGLLIVGHYNHSKTDRTKWYSIDYEVLETIENSPLCKVCTMESAKSALCNGQNLHDDLYTETTSRDYSHRSKNIKLSKAHDYVLEREKRDLSPKMGDRPIQPEQSSINGFDQSSELHQLGKADNSETDQVVPPFLSKNKKERILSELPIGDDGWLAIPEDDRYKLARFIATRRMQYHLLSLAMGQGPVFAVRMDLGKYVFNGRQMMIWKSKINDLGWEDEVFASEGRACLRNLRDLLHAQKRISKEWFNDTLSDFFHEAQWFLLQKGAKEKFETTPIAVIFNDELLVERFLP